MDDIDRAILNCLRNNARISNRELAEQVHLSPSAALERVRKLKRSGIIKGFCTMFDCAKLGRGLNVLIELEIEKNIQDHDIADKLVSYPEITAIYDVAGDADYLLKVAVPDSEALRQLMNRISLIPGVRSSHTTLVLRTLKEEISPEI